MKRSGAVLNEVCSLAMNHHKQPITVAIIMSTLRTC
ncbi:hypothetical protein T05_12069 [Trichinella murrelli]|uniref:Uncharacterized protein n=1 Tax=Trichinella murrelli TaxID=144512 RepID=A0A0V0SR56_9BILA|nr:hypothetical protein T05_2216 [Trichinella murrelli]KRX29408.1 hypothetical protein T05_12069 [Trichinella murrelli]